MHKKLRILTPIGRFFGAGEILTGQGSFTALSALKQSRIFIIHSASFIESLDGIALVNKTFKNKPTYLSQVPKGEPILENLNEMIQEIREFKPDCILAIGGGSVIDTGKLIWIMYEHPDITETQLSKAFSVPSMRGKANFVAVPTTAGTGSEMSSAAVFKFTKESSKQFAVSHDLLPDIAILDPNFIINVPRIIKINSALDALAHSFEGYVSLFRNSYTQDLAEQSIRNIFNSMADYVVKNDIKAADTMLRASNLAGVVQNISIPGLGHAISHSLSNHDISHGHACGRFLPIAMMINSQKDIISDLYDTLAIKLNLKGGNALVDKINNYLEEYEVTISKSLLSSLKTNKNFIENTLIDPTARANPIKLHEQHIVEALERAVK